MIDRDEFLVLPDEEVARLVRQAGPQVCVFPINGTRRWFTLEYGDRRWEDPLAAYMDIASQNHIGLYRLFFEHGIDTLLTPFVGPDILARGGYMARIGAEGFARLVQGEDFLDFYDSFDVRVRFYGNYRQALAETPYAYLSDLFDSITVRTQGHARYRLFFGAFANDATETVGRLAIRHFQQTGEAPDRQTLVSAYYGEYVEPATLFIGFDRFSAFDYPLLALGREDMYFTASPSPYMNATLLRSILYDHLFTRSAEDPDYNSLSAEALTELRRYYHHNRGYAYGVGDLHHGIWTPLQEPPPP